MADSGDVPLLKVGILGDIQGYPAAYDWGMHNLEKAFRLLAPKKPDVLIMDGDLSDCGDSAAFPYYQAMVARCFPDKRPVPAVCAGNHDYGRDNPSAHEDLCRAVGQDPANPGHIVLNGYDFIMVSDRVTGRDGSQHYTEAVLARLEEELKKAVARDLEKPVFVITHFPPSGTMAGSHGAEGSKDLRELFVASDLIRLQHRNAHLQGLLLDRREMDLLASVPDRVRLGHRIYDFMSRLRQHLHRRHGEVGCAHVYQSHSFCSSAASGSACSAGNTSDALSV